MCVYILYIVHKHTKTKTKRKRERERETARPIIPPGGSIKGYTGKTCLGGDRAKTTAAKLALVVKAISQKFYAHVGGALRRAGKGVHPLVLNPAERKRQRGRERAREPISGLGYYFSRFSSHLEGTILFAHAPVLQ